MPLALPTTRAYSAINTQASTLQTSIDAKQNKLTFDTTPTQNSSNPVTSGGVYTAINSGSSGRAPICSDYSEIVHFGYSGYSSYRANICNTYSSAWDAIGISYGSSSSSIYNNYCYVIFDISPFKDQYSKDDSVEGACLSAMLQNSYGFIPIILIQDGPTSGGGYVSLWTSTDSARSPAIYAYEQAGGGSTVRILDTSSSSTALGIRIWRCKK